MGMETLGITDGRVITFIRRLPAKTIALCTDAMLLEYGLDCQEEEEGLRYSGEKEAL